MPTKTANEWFTVDKEGLAALLEDRGKEFALFELIANAWDEPGVTNVRVSINPTRLAGRQVLYVEDNAPGGFLDLNDSHRLFGGSRKRANPEVRGRFNLGEKLVLAIAEEAEVVSTSGTVYFKKDGTREVCICPIHRRREGTLVRAVLRMRKDEAREATRQALRLISPEGITTTINGNVLPARASVRTIRVSLPTVIEVDGVMRQAQRTTDVVLYERLPGHKATLYELGVPVVENGDDRWDYDVRQKVSLNKDRDNVPPSYLRRLRTEVVNATAADLMRQEDAVGSWVTEALTSPEIEPEAVQAVITHRFGPKAVSFDLSDPEANKIAVSQGYTVVHGGSLPRAAWDNVRKAEALTPAGKVTPSNGVEFGSDGVPPIDPAKWSAEMRIVAAHARALAVHVLQRSIDVQWYASLPGKTGVHCSACYAPGKLSLSKLSLSAELADPVLNGGRAIDRLLIHEFGHEWASDHLSVAYHEALCRIGAAMRGAPTIAEAADLIRRVGVVNV